MGTNYEDGPRKKLTTCARHFGEHHCCEGCQYLEKETGDCSARHEPQAGIPADELLEDLILEQNEQG